jgi:hypothetical protein
MEIYQHVDAPMHLLFLGVVRTTVKRVLEWTKYKNKYNSFIGISSGLLEQVSRLHLNWCCNSIVGHQICWMGIRKLPRNGSYYALVLFIVASSTG